MSALVATLPNSNRCTVCRGVLSPPKGQTYAVRRGAWVKIGKSGRPEQRFRKLRGAVPAVLIPEGMNWSDPLDVLVVLPHDVEHQVHEALAESHEIGEWFRDDDAVRTWIAGVAS